MSSAADTLRLFREIGGATFERAGTGTYYYYLLYKSSAKSQNRNTNHTCTDKDDERQTWQIISIKITKLGIRLQHIKIVHNYVKYVKYAATQGLLTARLTKRK